MMRAARAVVAVTAVVVAVAWAAPPPAAASPGGVLCTLTGLVSGALGKVCTLATHAGKVVGAGRKLLGGHVGGAIGALTGSSASPVTKAVGLAAIAAAAVAGARWLLGKTAAVVGTTTRPNLSSTWFSAAYWRMAAIATLLTLPFLFAAAVQALIRSDLALLARAAFGYLPLAMLGVGVAAPLTALLLSGSDEMSALVASASGHGGAGFLGRAIGVGGVIDLFGPNLFVSFFVALLTATATIALWAELLVREAAVYVIVLMLPLFFAAMVWPARRIWAARSVELLIALILSKFVIVAVLTLGGAALGHTLAPGPASILTGMTLVLLAAFSPWALMRLLPLQELAGAAAGGLWSGGLRSLPNRLGGPDGAERPPELEHHVSAASDDDGDDGSAQPSEAPTEPPPSGERDGSGRRDGAGELAGDPPAGPGEPVGDPPAGADAHQPDGDQPVQGDTRPPMRPEFQSPNRTWRELIHLGDIAATSRDVTSDDALVGPDPDTESVPEDEE
jgi:hypothetical protein